VLLRVPTKTCRIRFRRSGAEPLTARIMHVQYCDVHLASYYDDLADADGEINSESWHDASCRHPHLWRAHVRASHHQVWFIVPYVCVLTLPFAHGMPASMAAVRWPAGELLSG
jgi:hypothetical protein